MSPPLHLIKLAVGIESLAHLRAVQARRLRTTGSLFHVTRYAPRRAAEVLSGGSIYWVIKLQVRARQRVRALSPHRVSDGGATKCAIVLDPALVPTVPVPRRPHQGWRYLAACDVPPDLESVADGACPPEMAAELRALGLL